MAGRIPEDLIIEILLRLSVEALLRFRCVSKRWCNLIDSPNFAKSQLNLPKKPKFVILVSLDKKLCVHFSKLDSDYIVLDKKKLSVHFSELDSDYIENPSSNFKKLTLPLRDEIFPNVSDYVGHCNGLLCCVDRIKCNFLVFNPFIGKHVQVPPPPEQDECWWGAWGFGYDKDSDDYKVVAVAHFRGFRCVLWIYNLKSSSWKNNIVDFHGILFLGCGVFVDGVLHWIGRHCIGRAPDFIFALNLGNLECFSLPRPSDNSKRMFHLGVRDGCLHTISSDCSDKCYDMWVMKEYGSKKFWTRLSTYNGPCDATGMLFAGYGSSLVPRKIATYWTKSRGCIPLVYEPSLVCPRGAI